MKARQKILGRKNKLRAIRDNQLKSAKVPSDAFVLKCKKYCFIDKSLMP